MSSSSNSAKENEQACSSTVTDVVNKKIVHNWVITNKSVQEGITIWDVIFPRDDSGQQLKSLESPVFSAEGHQWRLILRPCPPFQQVLTADGFTLVLGVSSVEVEIVLLSKDTTDLWIMYGVFLLDVNSATKRMGSNPCLENVARKEAKYNFVVRNQRGVVNEKMLNLTKEKLLLQTEITIIRSVGDVWHKIKVPSYTLRNKLKAAMNFKEGMKGEDVTIITAATADGDDGEEEDEQEKEPRKFSAHKFILAARSPVFAKMFEHEEMSENKLNEVRIEDIEPDVLEEMLKFVYTGEVTRLQELAIPLLYASEKYELKRLKALCERQLAIDVKVENAANLLVVSSQCDAQQLKEVVLKFVAFNGQEVMKTEEWDRVREAGLENEVLRTIFNNPEVDPPTKKAKLSS